MIITGRCIQIEQREKGTNTVTFLLSSEEAQKEIRAIGIANEIEQGLQYSLEGEYHPDGTFRFGIIKKMASCRQESIDLLCDCVTGVSVQIARRIVDELGDDIFSYSADKELTSKLLHIQGVGKKKADAIVDFIQKGTEENEVFQMLSSFEVPYTSILMYLSDHPKSDTDAISKDPYKLMKYDVPFKICDQIAMKMDLDPWSLNRIQAMITQTTKRMENRGDTRMEYEEFIRSVARFSFVEGKSTTSVPPDLIRLVVRSCEFIKDYADKGVTYITTVNSYNQERSIMQNTRRIASSGKPLIEAVDEIIEEIEKQENITYNQQQRKVFDLFRHGGIGILLGGPGTGKTTTVNGIVKAYLSRENHGNILLCAPTGRAAARMTEISGYTAKTIHKAMQLKWYNHDTKVEPLEYDFIIADEMSMCDTELFSLFTKAIQSGTTLLIVGDYNQIPSVGPGQVLRDLVESEVFPVYRLTEIIRQKKGSLIIENADRILNGEMLKTGTEFQVAIAKNDNGLYHAIQKMEYEKIPQILCPIKKTVAGTRSLNLLVQSKRSFSDKGAWLDGMRFHEGDKIIMNTNNYEIGYMNGDVGTIRSIQNGYLQIDFTDKSLNISMRDLDGIHLSYALTFHKSQGAETDDILIILPTQASCMASRELLYTAVTRAKKKVWLLATEGVLETYLAADKKMVRNCGLKSWLLGEIQ